MSAAVNLNKTDFVGNARACWGKALPDWVAALARECARGSASGVAQRLGYSVAVVSSVVRCNYRGDLGKVEAKVRGAFMGEVLECPVLGEIARDRCIAEQGRKFVGSSAVRAKLFRACRAGCAHSRLAGDRKETSHAA